MVTKKSRIFIAGHRGMVGSALVKYFKNQGVERLILVSSKKLNLLKRNEFAGISYFE